MNKKVAAVIGGSGGIGIEITRAYLQQGFQVHSFYNKNPEALRNATQEYSQDQLSIASLDLADDSSVTTAFENVRSKHQKLDVIVYAPTPAITNRSVLDLPWTDYQTHFEVQVRGLYRVVQAMKQQILEKHRTRFIVVLTDYVVGVPPGSVSQYVTAKYALMGFAKSLVADLSRFNCTVNMLSPGMVQTDLLSGLPPKLVQITAESNPMKRIGVPKDVAGVALFLASEASEYLNGAHITVDGGRTML